jgi:Txe/YoeB family toxin of Txe-Axe toxin-antitoxin module
MNASLAGTVALGAAAAALVLVDRLLVESSSAPRRNAAGAWSIELGARARKEIDRYKANGMDRELATIKRILRELATNPFARNDNFQYVDKLRAYTRDIDFRRRITFTIDKASHTVYVTDLWSHSRSNS